MRPVVSKRFAYCSRLLSISQIRLVLFAAIVFTGLGWITTSLLFPPPVHGLSTEIVISQVYGGGGNSGTVYKNDFVELFNRGLAPVTMTNWSVQYATSSGTSWSVVGPLNFTLQPGQYYLIQLAAGGGGTTNLPTPDFSASSPNPSATAGKIALVNNTTALSGVCPTGVNIIDFVGYGSSANCFEMAPTAAPSNTNAVLRQGNGCTETDNNSTDFATGAPNPRNSASPTFSCFTAPTVTAHPADQIVAPEATVSFTSAASGTAPLAVQWQVSTDGGMTWNNLAGATNTTLTLSVVTLADHNKRFRAQFSNVLGMATSNPALLSVLIADAKLLDPFGCIGDGTTLNVRAEIINTSNIPVDGVFRAQLRPGLVTRNSSCVITGTGNCSFTGEDRVRWGGTLQPAEKVVIEYQAQVKPGVVTGTELCITSTFEFNAGPIATVQACTKVNCPIIPTGGEAPIGVAAGDAKPGSVLFFNYYASDIARPQLENTRINFTNTDGARGVALHLFFVSSDDCRVADTFICLTANQTTSILASEYDPGMKGFLVAVAVDGQSGCPINFNHLLGSEFIKLNSGHATSLNAIAIAAVTGGPMACDPTDTTARLDFDGTDYNLVPRALAVNNIQSPLDGNDTLLILNRIGGNFSTGTATRLGDLLGLVYDENERGYSFSFDPSGCQYVRRIMDGAPRTSPPLTKVIPTGHSGWMRFQHVADSAMFGAVINLNPNGFSHGRNLHALSYTDASITIPIIPPVCGQ